MSLGTRLGAMSGNIIRRYGELLTVTRRAATEGGAGTTSTVRFLVQPLSPTGWSSLAIEGALTAGESEAKDFVCTGSDDVREAIDEITYQSQQFRVHSVDESRIAGANVARHCVGIRTGVPAA